MKKTIAAALLVSLFTAAPMLGHAFKIGPFDIGDVSICKNLRVCQEDNSVRAQCFGKDGKFIPSPWVMNIHVKNNQKYADVNFYLLLTIRKDVPVVACQKSAAKAVHTAMTTTVSRTVRRALTQAQAAFPTGKKNSSKK